MKLSNRRGKSSFIILAIIAIIAFFYYNYFLTPILDQYELLDQKVVNNEQELGELKETDKEIDMLLENIEKSKQEIAGLENILPSNKKVPEVIVQLEAFAYETGLELQQIVFEETKKDKNKKEKQGKKQNEDYFEINLQLVVEGAYEDVLSFLEKLENSSRLFVVDNIFLSRSSQINNGNISVQLGISTFAIKHKGQLMEEPDSYDFVAEKYARENPFEPLLEEKRNPAFNPSNYSGSNYQTHDDEQLINDYMENLFKIIIDEETD